MEDSKHLELGQFPVVSTRELPFQGVENDFDLFVILGYLEMLDQRAINLEETGSRKDLKMCSLSTHGVIQVVGQSVLVASQGRAEPTDQVIEMRLGHVDCHEVTQKFESRRSFARVHLDLLDLLLDGLNIDSGLKESQDGGDTRVPYIRLDLIHTFDGSLGSLHELPGLESTFPIEFWLWQILSLTGGSNEQETALLFAHGILLLEALWDV